MTKDEQQKFVIDITTSLQDAILERVNSLPDNWDGLEIRRWIADYYILHYRNCGYFTGKRKRDYNNELKINPKLT